MHHFARVVALLAVLFGLSAAPAFAHDPWESTGLALNPASPDELVLRTNRGVAFSNDGGDTWRFLCRFALDNFSPVPAVTANHQVMLGMFFGLETINNDGCDRQSARNPMSGLWISDLMLDPTNNAAWFATTSTGGDKDNGLFRSTDHGATWDALGTLERGPFFKQVRSTPDASRIYVAVAEYFAPTETEPEHVDYSVRMSDDNAAHWTSTKIELEHDDNEMVLLDVDPTNPDRVFVAIHACRETNRCFDETRGQRQDRILVSEDAGETWEPFFEVDEVASFEINNEHIWVGDWWGGFWRMNRDGSNPELLDELLKPGCLIASGDDLYVCGTDVFGFMLAKSTDDGDTLTTIASASNILGNPVCEASDTDAGIDISATCRQEWMDLCYESYSDEANPPLECAPFLMDGGVSGTGGSGAVGGAGGNAGSSGMPDPNGGGCNCSAAGSSTPGSRPWTTGLLGIALLWVASARFRRRPQQ